MTRDQYKHRLAERIMTMFTLKAGHITTQPNTDPRAHRNAMVIEALAQAEAFMAHCDSTGTKFWEGLEL